MSQSLILPWAPVPSSPNVPWGNQPGLGSPALPVPALPRPLQPDRAPDAITIFPTPPVAKDEPFDYAGEGGRHWSRISAIGGGIAGAAAGAFGGLGLGGMALGAIIGTGVGFLGGYVTGWTVGTGLEETGAAPDEDLTAKGAVIGAVLGTAQLAVAAAFSRGPLGIMTKLNPVLGAVGGALIASHLERRDDPPPPRSPAPFLPSAV